MIKQYVIDQNFLREPNPKLHYFLQKGNQVVLTEYACMETYKGDSILNLRRSLEIVSKYPHKVLVLKGIQDVIQQTYKPLKSIRRNIIDAEQTELFTEFCCDVYSLDVGEDSAISKEYRTKSQAANKFFLERLVDAAKILEATRLTEKGLSQEELKQLRRKEFYSKELIEKIIRSVLAVTATLLSSHRLPNKGFSLVKNCYLFRYVLSSFFLAFKWISEGGYQNIDLKKFSNDLIDMSYVAHATYFDGLFTKDNKIKEIYTIIDAIAKAI